ncbi:MAG TPA: hypothetical protein VLD39_08215 [Gammaproteobacteria bacterium]|nr:hypothetical protein [Gammaproteobacteria bacterium]
MSVGDDDGENERVESDVRDIAERARRNANNNNSMRNTFDQVDNLAAVDMLDVDFTDPTALAQSQQQVVTSGTARQHQTHTLRAQYLEGKCKSIMAIGNKNDRAAARIAMQFNSLQQYKYKCTSPQANVSEQGRIINLWKRTQSRIGMLRVNPATGKFVDPNISFFGNLVVSFFDGLERFCNAYTAHDATFRVILSFLNAYPHIFDLVRLHLVFHGSPATSKSWPIVMASLMFIPNTVSRVSSRSRHASNIEDDELDKPIAMEEMPDEMLLEKNDRDDLQNEMKEWMTRGKSRREIKVIDNSNPNGGSQHKQKSLETEKGIVLVGATNRFPSEFNRAIRDRLDVIHQVLRKRCDVSFDSVAAASKSKSNALLTGRAAFFHETRMLQMLVYDLEKLIMIGTILEPTLAVFDLVMPLYRRVLSRKFGIDMGRRVKEKCRMMTRTLVVMNALMWLYRSPASPLYGEHYNEWHLLVCEPLLRDTEEIVHFALDMYRDQSIDPNREAVLDCLRNTVIKEMFEEKCSGDYGRMFTTVADSRNSSVSMREFQPHGLAASSLRERFASNKLDQRRNAPTASNSKAGMIDQIADLCNGASRYSTASMSRAARSGGGGDASSTSAQRARNELERFRDMQRQQPSSSSPNSHKRKRDQQEDDEEPPKEVDFNYVPIHKSLTKLSVLISSAMRRTGTSRELRPEEVEGVLKNLGKQQLHAQSYRRKTEQTAYPPVEVDPDSREKQYDALRLKIDGSQVLLHVQLLWAHNQDPHEAAIQEVRTAFTPRAKFVTALPVRDDLPQLLRVRHMSPSRRIETLKDARTGACNKLLRSLDEHSAVVRMIECGIPRSQKNKAFFTQIVNDKLARQKRHAVAPDACNYPDDRVASIERDVEVRDELERQGADVGAWAALHAAANETISPEMERRAEELLPEEREALNEHQRRVLTEADLDAPGLSEIERIQLRMQYEEQQSAMQEELARTTEAFEEDEWGTEPVQKAIEKPDMPPPPSKQKKKKARLTDPRPDPLLELGRSNEPGVSMSEVQGTADIIGQLRQFMNQVATTSDRSSHTLRDSASEDSGDEIDEDGSEIEVSSDTEEEEQEEESASEIEMSSDSASEVEVSSDSE